MPYKQAEDKTELHYRDWGTGVPVVLIHGWPLTCEMWEKQAEFLASNGVRVITYDRRGFGFSGHPWSGYDYDTFASDLNVLMETLDLRGAVLVGFSMGGGEVARYLGRYGSSRVSKAVLISSVTPYLLKTADNPDGIEAEEFQKIENALRTDRPDFLKDFGAKFYNRSMLNHSVSDAVLQWNQNVCLTATLHATIAAAKAWSSTDFRADLRKITVPTLLIHGTSDQTVPIEKSAHKAVQLVKNAILREYEGEPHGLFLTAADQLNNDLLAFIQTGDVPTLDPQAAETVFASAVLSQ